MTRKDYQLIAKALHKSHAHSLPHRKDAEGFWNGYRTALYDIMFDLSGALEKDNPRFDSERFYVAVEAPDPIRYEQIENQDQFDNWIATPEGRKYCDLTFACRMFDLDLGCSTPSPRQALDGHLFPIPYWLDAYDGDEQCLKGNRYQAQYVPSEYASPWRIGDINTLDGESWKLIDTVPLDTEEEHQLENGTFVYEYRGYSYLRILERVG